MRVQSENYPIYLIESNSDIFSVFLAYLDRLLLYKNKRIGFICFCIYGHSFLFRLNTIEY